MVRCWQSRVENAEARRQQAKQRKQRSEDKRIFKNMTQELLGLFDRQYDSLRKAKGRGRRVQLHIWTDTLAADSPPDLLSSVGGKQPKKARSASIESEGSGRKGGRSRSNSVNEKQSKKKAHPRSKETATDTPEKSSQSNEVILCKPHFFTGKCPQQGRKGGGCRYMHYTIPQYKTLYAVCSDGGNTKRFRGDAISEAEDAVHQEEDPDTMEMLYFCTHELLKKDSEESPVSEALIEALAEKRIGLGSIVYAAVDDVLVFDRNRDGLILSERDFLISALGDEATGLRRISVGTEDEVNPDLFFLPGPVLEYILTFLPDSAVAVATQVCKAWHHEIGQNSPNLWRYMLERREWPLPKLEDHDHAEGVPNQDAIDVRQRLFRDAFLRHYGVVRDVTAIQSALGGLTGKRSGGEKEMSFQDFSTRKQAPCFPNKCSSVHVWGPNRVLAAYPEDCSLRLFATVPKVGCNEMLCRELVCQRVDPYRNTKKRSCSLVAVDLDDEAVGSLFVVTADGVNAAASVLVILSRDDFLLGEGGDVPLSVIDIGEAVLNYVLSCDEIDHRLLQMIDFLADGGDIGDVEVLVSQSMIACGHGRFMAEVAISVPALDVEDEGADDRTMLLLDRKLVLFSASVGAIVWMGECHPISHEPRPREEGMLLTHLRRPLPGATRASCVFAVYCLTSPVVMVGEIEPSGNVHTTQLVDGCEAALDEIREEGWNMFSSRDRPILVTPSDVISANNMSREVENRRNEGKAFLSFFPRYKSAGDDEYVMLPIPGDMEIIRISSFRDQHIVVICRECVYHDEPPDALPDGQWFTDDSFSLPLFAVVVHVPTRREIARIKLLDDQLDDQSGSTAYVPHITVTCDNTVGVGVSYKGLIMTGSDVRSLSDTSDAAFLDNALMPVKAAKGKKKRRQTKGGKKDEFARGMSMRG